MKKTSIVLDKEAKKNYLNSLYNLQLFSRMQKIKKLEMLIDFENCEHTDFQSTYEKLKKEDSMLKDRCYKKEKTVQLA